MQKIAYAQTLVYPC